MQSYWGPPIIRIDSQDSSFPETLRLLTDPPQQLFGVGDFALLDQDGVGVVGSRKMTAYGTWGINHFVPLLVKVGLTVISGLAYGVDAAAQQKALIKGGKVIAVLASGLDQLYPVEHYQLSKQILDSGGLILSEYPPGTRAKPHQFLARNRIIAGLARLVMVMEAGPKSGSLVTARAALAQGKEVVVLTGDLTRENSKGIVKLLNDGARAVCEVEEVLALLEYKLDLKLVEEIKPPLTGSLATLYALLLQGPSSTEQLLVHTGLNLLTLHSLLAVLELDGYIELNATQWQVIY